jgi:hypothetical protein
MQKSKIGSGEQLMQRVGRRVEFLSNLPNCEEKN